MKKHTNKPIPFEDFTDEQLDDFLTYSEPFTEEHLYSINEKFIRERSAVLSDFSQKKQKNQVNDGLLSCPLQPYC